MTETLKYYIAFNNGLKVMRARAASMTSTGEFFPGKTLEHLMGCRRYPEVVFAAVAFDGGQRTGDGGRSWRKVIEGDFHRAAEIYLKSIELFRKIRRVIPIDEAEDLLDHLRTRR